MKVKSIILTATILGALSVITGAMGAHALKAVLEPEALTSYLTGSRYNMYHALALLAIAGIHAHLDPKWMKNGVLLITWGTILFSGSIYLLSTSSITGLNISSILGPITPIGGLLIIFGWVSIALAAVKK